RQHPPRKQPGDGRVSRSLHAALAAGEPARSGHRQRQARLGSGEHTARRVALRPHGLPLGLGILHNDGNCLDCDYGDTYDRIAFAPREIKGHTFTFMFDLLSKGAGTTGEFGELGRSVDLDTLDDGYRLGLSITRLDTPEAVKRKLDAGQWVYNYGLLLDYRTQGWDTVTTTDVSNVSTLGQFFPF